MSGTTYYQRNREVILNRAKDYYENNKELLRERTKNKYRELSEEEKNRERECGKSRYHNMSEEKKKRLKEYQKTYRDAKRHISQIQMSIKEHYKIAIAKIFFFRSFIKIRWIFNNNNKSLECMGPFGDT